MEEYVGQLWDRFITHAARRDHPHAAVTLAEVERATGVLFRALGGEGGLRIAVAGSTAHGARRRWRERLAGNGERAEFAWRDDRALYLPAQIAVFAERALNRDLYLWLTALAAVDAGAEQDWFTRSQCSVRQVLERYPGLRARYRRLVQAQLALRPLPETLPADEARQERAVRAALQAPGSVALLPAARRAPAPVWLWLHPQPPRRNATTAPDSDDADASAANGPRGARDRVRRAAERTTSPDGRSGLLLYRFEGIFGIGEFARVNRGTEDGDADNVRVDDFDKLAIARDAQSVASRVRFDLDLPSAGDDDAPLGPGLLLPEWDYRRQTLRPNHCRLQPLVAAHAMPCGLPEALRHTARRLRHQFEALRPLRLWRNGQADGSEPDLDAWLRHRTEQVAGQVVATPNLYRRRECGRRDLACLLLADLSLSTDSWVGHERRVIDVIRDSLWLFSEALTATGDRFALHGFSSRKRELVRFHHLKGFDEAYSPLVRGRIQAIKPGYYTRMGAAIRQATALLTREPAAQRLLLVLTDGKPNDLDQYEGRYGVEDTRHAVQAARRAGLTPFCVTIDDEAADYLPHLFGAGSYVMIRRPEQLPRLLPQLYARLTYVH